jgi:hypothetical protein
VSKKKPAHHLKSLYVLLLVWKKEMKERKKERKKEKEREKDRQTERKKEIRRGSTKNKR